MKKLFSLFAVSMLFACGSSRVPEAGTYYGYLPCADCPGISYALDLKADGTYRLQRFYSDRSDAPTENTGTYTVENDRINLSGGELNDLTFTGDQLVVMDKSGEPITGELADRYVLGRDKPADWRMEAKKTRSSVESVFRASGNEPFWSVTFTESQMTFEGLDLEAFSAPLPDPVMPADREAYAFRAQTEAGDLFVTLFPEKCDDTMADKSYAFRTMVSLRRGNEKDPTNYSGCGEFTVSEPLAGEWRVLSLNGKDLPKSGKGPTIIFDLANGQLAGSTGCNRYSGGFSLDADTNTFTPGQLVSTEMACTGDNPEAEFLQVMNAGKLSYRVIPGRIYLRAGAERMVLGQ